jgi:hypothetical protein
VRITNWTPSWLRQSWSLDYGSQFDGTHLYKSDFAEPPHRRSQFKKQPDKPHIANSSHRHNLPADIEALFTQSPAIKDVVELALGANGTYFVSYRDEFSQILCKHYNLPNALTSWLYCSHPSIIRDLATLSITLGPYDSYYAWDKTSASWSNLPPKLEKAILNRVESQDAWKTTWKAGGAEAPSFVSLGADEAYWMRTVSGGGCWDLKCSAPPSNPGATDGMAGLRGTNKFLEDSADFNGVAVRSFLV